jgi:hypothetical protein
MQVQSWNWLKFIAQGQINTQVATKLIITVLIPASEASCEGSLSSQKQIMEHFRAKSSEIASPTKAESQTT